MLLVGAVTQLHLLLQENRTSECWSPSFYCTLVLLCLSPSGFEDIGTANGTVIVVWVPLLACFDMAVTSRDFGEINWSFLSRTLSRNCPTCWVWVQLQRDKTPWILQNTGTPRLSSDASPKNWLVQPPSTHATFLICKSAALLLIAAF